MSSIDGSIVQESVQGFLDRGLLKLTLHVLNDVITMHNLGREVLHQADDGLKWVCSTAADSSQA